MNCESPIYILLGARGTGKTVLLSEFYDYFNLKNDWIVIDVNPHRNILEDIVATIYDKGKLKKIFTKKSFNFSFKGSSFSIEGDNPISSIGVLLEKMLEYLAKKTKKF